MSLLQAGSPLAILMTSYYLLVWGKSWREAVVHAFGSLKISTNFIRNASIWNSRWLLGCIRWSLFREAFLLPVLKPYLNLIYQKSDMNVIKIQVKTAIELWWELLWNKQSRIRPQSISLQVFLRGHWNGCKQNAKCTELLQGFSRIFKQNQRFYTIDS